MYSNGLTLSRRMLRRNYLDDRKNDVDALVPVINSKIFR